MLRPPRLGHASDVSSTDWINKDLQTIKDTIRELQSTAASNTSFTVLQSTVSNRVLSGTYGSRPLASSVPDKSLYLATDVSEVYLSSGGSWVFFTGSGSELGTASITAVQSTGSVTPVDVTGLSVTFTAGERPVVAQLDCDLANSNAASTTTITIDRGGTVVGTAASLGIAVDTYHAVSKGFRVSGLTPGASYTIKAQIHTSANTGRIFGSATNPSRLSIIST